MVNTQKALSILWKGVCNVYIRRERKNLVNKRTEFDEVEIYTNEPCRLSFSSSKQLKEADNASEINQVIKLFISNEFSIPAGSKITVTQNAKTADYERSGEPAIYTNHQEIVLELFKGWA